MKVRVTVTVNIDPEAWTSNYGVEGAQDIREDVRNYCTDTVRSQLESVGVLDEAASTITDAVSTLEELL